MNTMIRRKLNERENGIYRERNGDYDYIVSIDPDHNKVMFY